MCKGVKSEFNTEKNICIENCNLKCDNKNFELNDNNSNTLEIEVSNTTIVKKFNILQNSCICNCNPNTD